MWGAAQTTFGKPSDEATLLISRGSRLVERGIGGFVLEKWVNQRFKKEIINLV